MSGGKKHPSGVFNEDNHPGSFYSVTGDFWIPVKTLTKQLHSTYLQYEPTHVHGELLNFSRVGEGAKNISFVLPTTFLEGC